MGLFGQSQEEQGQPQETQKHALPDDILGNLLRGVEGRHPGESKLSQGYWEPIKNLRSAGFNDGREEIFLGVVEATTRKNKEGERITSGGFPVGYADNRHLMTIAGSRSGKGRSAIIPNLLTYGSSVLVIDPKGENASITAQYRERDGGKVHVLDPFNITKNDAIKHRAYFNPLTVLTHNRNERIIEDAAFLADALVVPSGSHDKHWDDSARFIIETVLLHVATSHEINRHDRTLVTVADLISGKVPFKELLETMKANKSKGGHISRSASTIEEIPDKELFSILSTARKNLRFLQYPAMRDIVSGHDFNLLDLKSTKTTVYLVLPATYLASASQWLRIFINLILRMAENERGGKEVLLILDEFAALGRMQELEQAIGLVAGYGLRLWTILQDLGQLKDLYRDRWESFCGNSGLIQCFGNVDQTTSEWVSKALGQTTIVVSDSSSPSLDKRQRQGVTGENDRSHTVALMDPAEVRRFFGRDDRYARQLILIPSKRPIILQRANYDQHQLFAGRFQLFGEHKKKREMNGEQ